MVIATHRRIKSIKETRKKNVAKNGGLTFKSAATAVQSIMCDYLAGLLIAMRDTGICVMYKEAIPVGGENK